MDTAPVIQKTYSVKLPRHDESRKATVISVNPEEKTAKVKYPNTTSRMALMGDLREVVSWEYIN